MIVGVASQFVLLPDEFIQIFTRKNFSGWGLFPHETKRRVISAGKTAFAKNSASVQQCRTREIIKGERDHRGFHLNPAWPAAKPPGKTALEWLGNPGPDTTICGAGNDGRMLHRRRRREQPDSHMHRTRCVDGIHDGLSDFAAAATPLKAPAPGPNFPEIGQPATEVTAPRAPRAFLRMHPKIAKLMPGALIANVLWKENSHVLCQIRIFSDGA